MRGLRAKLTDTYARRERAFLWANDMTADVVDIRDLLSERMLSLARAVGALEDLTRREPDLPGREMAIEFIQQYAISALMLGQFLWANASPEEKLDAEAEVRLYAGGAGMTLQ